MENKTTKFILMYCQDREMSCHGVFNTHEEAYEVMKEEFDTFHKEELDMDDLEIVEACANGEECELFKWAAWSNMGRVPLDWQIAEVEIPVDTETKEDA